MIYYFGYEKGSTGRWSPVLYHGEKPKIKHGQRMSTNGALAQITEPVEIREEFEPSFGYLMKQFPPPQEEIKMVRPVEGFRTDDGQFFDTEHEATIHEVTFKLTREFYTFVRGWDFLETIDDEKKDAIIIAGLEFISDHADEVRRYLEAKSILRVPETEKAGDGEDRPATEGTEGVHP